MNNYTRYWNFTWDTNALQKKLPDETKLINFLDRETQEAIFQREKGEKKKKEHYQGMFTLDSKRTSKSSVLTLFAGTFKNVHGLTLTPTYSSIASSKYVTKEEGRIRGPFYCGKSEKYDPEFATMRLSKWQNQMYEDLCSEEAQSLRGRNLITVHDSGGKSGKSQFAKWLRVGQKKLTVRKLPIASVQQLNSAVYLITKNLEVDIFIIDITRSKGKDQHFEDLFSALEDVINGFVVDVMFGRYHEALFKPPLILVFTNYKFEELYQYMSDDRWIPLQLSSDKELAHIIHHRGEVLFYTPYVSLTETKKD